MKNNTRNNERYYAIWTRDPGEGHKRHKEIRNNVYVASGDAGSVTPAGVQDSSLDAAGNRKIETLLTDIVTRLDRIEEKIDENVYPPESAIRPEFIRQVKKAEADIRKGKGKTYESMGAFVKAISE